MQTLSQTFSNDAQVTHALNRAAFEVRKAKRPNYYDLLHVPSIASQLEVKAAYKQRALEWHPDKHTESEEARLKAEVRGALYPTMRATHKHTHTLAMRAANAHLKRFRTAFTPPTTHTPHPHPRPHHTHTAPPPPPTPRPPHTPHPPHTTPTTLAGRRTSSCWARRSRFWEMSSRGSCTTRATTRRASWSACRRPTERQATITRMAAVAAVDAMAAAAARDERGRDVGRRRHVASAEGWVAGWQARVQARAGWQARVQARVGWQARVQARVGWALGGV